MNDWISDWLHLGKDNCDLCYKRKHSMMLHSRVFTGVVHTHTHKTAQRSERSVFEHWQLWCLHLALINLDISGVRSFVSLWRSLWHSVINPIFPLCSGCSSGTLSESLGALTFLKAVDAPVSGWSAIDEWMLVFSCLFSEPNWKRALVPVLGLEGIDSKRSMWQPSPPTKWCHRLN